MRRFFRIGVLVLAMINLFLADTANAANNTSWFRNDIEDSSLRYSNTSSRGQCGGSYIQVYSYDTHSYGNGWYCTTPTRWGSVLSIGKYNYIQVGLSYTAYHKIDLPSSVYVTPSPESNRLYVVRHNSNGTYQIGYILNPATSLNFNTITRLYSRPTITYLPHEFSTFGFSNDSGFLVGVTSAGQIRRVSLYDFSVATISVSTPIHPSALEFITVSIDGSLVAGLSSSGHIGLYDFEGCQKGYCSSKRLTTTPLEPRERVASIYLDGVTLVSVLTHEFDNNISRYNFWPQNETRYVSYVALGDSFSSGEGSWSYVPGTDGNEEYAEEKCHQGYDSYPFRYMQHFMNVMDRSAFSGSSGMKIQTFITATCSGAKMEDIWQNTEAKKDNYPGHYDHLRDEVSRARIRTEAVENQIPGRALQRDFLSEYQPDIATIGIGGNDVDFAGIVKACISSVSTCPQASTKRAESGQAIRGKFTALVNTFKDLHDASPSTRLYAVGYPSFVSSASWSGCSLNSLFDRTERTFIKEGVNYLNTVIEAAAKKAGIGYIDVESALGNAALCGAGAEGVNGIALGNDIELKIAGQKIKMIGQESFHPNNYGYELIANRIIADYGELDTYRNWNCAEVASGYCPNNSVTAPAVPAYFKNSNGKQSASTVESKESVTIFQKILNIAIAGLRPMSKVGTMAYSEPRSLGTYTVNPDGTFNQDIQLPDDLEPGYHTIYWSGTLANGEPVEYQQVILYLPPETKTGPCGILPYSNIDQDADGIDDACDPSIDVSDPIRLEDPSSVLIYPNASQIQIAGDAQSSTSQNTNIHGSGTALDDTVLSGDSDPADPAGAVVTTAENTWLEDTAKTLTQPSTVSIVVVGAVFSVGIAVLVAGVYMWRKSRISSR